MVAPVKKVNLPSPDKRWKIVDATMRRYGYVGHVLIESLHKAQESFGFLNEASLRFIASSLRLPLSKVYGVATFYHFFSLKPQGEHSCVVCMGTACYIKGAPDCIDAVGTRYGIKPGQTTGDNKVSLLTARCIGSCGLAPAAVLDGEVMGKITPDKVLARMEGWQS